MTVLITGATGYIGGAFARALSADGCSAVAIGRSDQETIDFDGTASVPYRQATTAPEILKVIRDHDVSVIAHFATNYIGRHEPDDVESVLQANVCFGTAVAEAAALSNAGMITFGTYWQYEGGTANATNSLYAATKRALDDIIDYYVASRDLRAQTMILYDVYGENDPRGKILTLLVDAGLTGGALELSTGNQLINLTHIDDVVAAARIACTNIGNDSPRVVSVRASDFLSIRELCGQVEDVLGCSIDSRWGARSDPPAGMLQPWLIDPVLPTWHPHVTLEAGVRRLARSRGWNGSTANSSDMSGK